MYTAFRMLAGPMFVLSAVSCGDSGGTDPIGGGGGGGGGGGSCPANTICMTGSTFSPSSRTVGLNTPVTWTNNSSAAHNVTFSNPAAALAVGSSGLGSFDAPATSSKQRQFDAPGTHTFFCTIHGGSATTGMRGSVVVQ